MTVNKPMHTVIGTGVAAALFLATHLVHAQDYPVKTIRLLNPLPAGGPTDILGRMIAQPVSEALGRQIVTDNRPGASGNIAAEMAAKAAPDGYTLFIAGVGNFAINVSLFRKLPYDPQRDFAPIALLATAPYVVAVHPSMPVTTIKELIALAKAKPGALNFGAVTGNGAHLAAELFKTAAGISIVHIPYKGSGQAVADVAAGQIQMVFSDMAPAVALIKGGKLRPLAVTSTQRSNIMPEIPTMIEAGYPNFESVVWWSLAAPKGTPQAVIQRLNADLSKIMVSAEIKEAFDKLGITPLFSTPARVHEIAKRDSPIIGELLRKSGVEKE